MTDTSSPTETIILVTTRFGPHSDPNWSIWPDQTFDQVVEALRARVQENHREMEVMQVTVRRHVAVKPVVETVDVVSVTA